MGGETKTGVALFVPQFAFSGEGSSLRRCRFLLTGILYFCAFLPQNTMQLTKTAPRVTLSRVGIKLGPLAVIYSPRRNFQEPNRYFICRFYGRSKKAVRNGKTFLRRWSEESGRLWRFRGPCRGDCRTGRVTRGTADEERRPAETLPIKKVSRKFSQRRQTGRRVFSTIY